MTQRCSTCGQTIRTAKLSSDGQAYFERFWLAYPRKVGKEAALQAFTKLNPDANTMTAIFAALAWQCQDWSDQKYIPHASSYLNGKRWQDEPTKAARPRTLGPDYGTLGLSDWREECDRLHQGRCGNVHMHTARMDS